MTIKRPQLRKLKERASYPVSLVSLVADVTRHTPTSPLGILQSNNDTFCTVFLYALYVHFTFSLPLLVIDALEKMRSALEMVELILVGVDSGEGGSGPAVVSAAASVE